MFMAAASAASIKTDVVEKPRAAVPDLYMVQMDRRSRSWGGAVSGLYKFKETVENPLYQNDELHQPRLAANPLFNIIVWSNLSSA